MAVASAPRPATGRAGRPAVPELIQRGGSDFLAAVVAHPGGRWAAELRTATALQLATAGVALPAVPEQDQLPQRSQLVGFAAMRGWRLVDGVAPSHAAFSLIEMSCKRAPSTPSHSFFGLRGDRELHLGPACRCGVSYWPQLDTTATRECGFFASQRRQSC